MRQVVLAGRMGSLNAPALEVLVTRYLIPQLLLLRG